MSDTISTAGGTPLTHLYQVSQRYRPYVVDVDAQKSRLSPNMTPKPQTWTARTIVNINNTSYHYSMEAAVGVLKYYGERTLLSAQYATSTVFLARNDDERRQHSCCLAALLLAGADPIRYEVLLANLANQMALLGFNQYPNDLAGAYQLLVSFVQVGATLHTHHEHVYDNRRDDRTPAPTFAQNSDSTHVPTATKRHIGAGTNGILIHDITCAYCEETLCCDINVKYLLCPYCCLPKIVHTSTQLPQL